MRPRKGEALSESRPSAPSEAGTALARTVARQRVTIPPLPHITGLPGAEPQITESSISRAVNNR